MHVYFMIIPEFFQIDFLPNGSWNNIFLKIKKYLHMCGI